MEGVRVGWEIGMRVFGVGGRGGVGNGLLLVYYGHSNDCNLDQEMDIGDNDYSKGICSFEVKNFMLLNHQILSFYRYRV